MFPMITSKLSFALSTQLVHQLFVHQLLFKVSRCRKILFRILNLTNLGEGGEGSDANL